LEVLERKRDGKDENYDWVQGNVLATADETSALPSLCLSQLRNMFFKMQKDSENNMRDVTFLCADGGPIYANRFMLAARSSVFRTMFTIQMMESENGQLQLEYPNYSFNGFFAFLYYLYTGEAIITNQNLIEVLTISNEFQVFELTDLCSKHVLDMMGTDNVCDLFNAGVHLYNKRIEKTLLNKMDTNFLSLSRTEPFMRISLDSMVELIQRDTINAEEGNVLMAVICWGLYQIEQVDDYSNWIKRVATRKTLEQQPSKPLLEAISSLLPYVRFSFISESYHRLYVPKQVHASAKKQRFNTIKRLTMVINKQELSSFRNTINGWRDHRSEEVVSTQVNNYLYFGVKIVSCDNHGNIMLGFSIDGVDVTVYGYNGAISKAGSRTGSFMPKFGQGDTIHLALSIIDGTGNIYMILNSEKDLMSTHSIGSFGKGQVVPMFRTYTPSDHLEFVFDESIIEHMTTYFISSQK
jgi:hypothetical protein